MYSLDFSVIYVNALQRHHVAKKSYFISIKIIFLQVGIKRVLSKLIVESSNYINMICFVGIDQDIMQVYDYKNIQLLYS